MGLYSHTAAWAMGLYTLQQSLHIIHLLVTVWANCWTSCISLSAVSVSHFQIRNKVAHCKSSHYCTSSQGHHPSTFPQFQNVKCQRHESSSTSPTSFFFFYSTSRHSPRHAVGGALRVESACHLALPSRGDNRPLNATEGSKFTEHTHPPCGCSAPPSPPSRHHRLLRTII